MEANETVQFEHVDPEHAASAEQEQKIAERALQHQAEVEAEIHVEEMRPMDRLEFAVEVVVDMLTPGRVSALRCAFGHVEHWSRALWKPRPEETLSRGQD